MPPSAMTADTQAPGRPQTPNPQGQGTDWGVASAWAIGILVVLVAGLVWGLVSMNSKLDQLQSQVASLPSGSTTVDTTDFSTRVDDACRVLGALAFKAGVDLPTAFGDEGGTGTCESAAEGAYHRLKTR